MLYLRNQAHEGPWELVKSGTSGAPGQRTTSANLTRRTSRHGSGEGGHQPPWAPLSTVARRGGPRPPKSPPSPPGKVEAMRLETPPVQEHPDQLVVEAKAQPALRRGQSGPHEVPLNQAR
jgi:hypothetical protein